MLLDYLKRSCGYEGIPEAVDLATPGGEIVDLANKDRIRDYANQHLENRASYNLCKISTGTCAVCPSVCKSDGHRRDGGWLTLLHPPDRVEHPGEAEATA